jgi:hypothetical protein
MYLHILDARGTFKVLNCEYSFLLVRYDILTTPDVTTTIMRGSMASILAMPQDQHVCYVGESWNM